MSEKIKRLKRELKYKGAIVDFYQDTMEIDGTHTATWDFISHKGAAAVVPVTEDGKILMVRQYRNALERYTLRFRQARWMRQMSRELYVQAESWRKRLDFAVRIWNG